MHDTLTKSACPLKFMSRRCMIVFVVDAKIQISSPAFFFPTAGGPGQSGLVLLPRLLTPGPAQYRVISTVIWKPVLKPGWALHSNSKYGRVNSHGPGWDSQINWDNQCSYRKLPLSSSFWTHSNIYYSWGKDYQLSPLAGLIKLKTLMVSWWSEHFSGPGCWIISGYCVRVRITEIIRFIVWIWAFIINIRIKFKDIFSIILWI